MNINKASLEAMGTSDEHFPKTGLKEVVLAGRSNVGKSSFINSMVNRKNLAYTSGRPGKTQTLNFYNIDDRLYFVDVPGYGYAKVSKKQRQEFGMMIENYLKNRKELTLAVLLIDFRHPPSEDDCLMYDFLKYYQIKTVIVATKSDKIGTTQHIKHEKMIKKTLNFDQNDYFIKYSSVTNVGRDDTWKLINKVIRE